TPESLRRFADLVGVAKRDNVIEVDLLEYAIREDLNKRATRVMAVLDPLKVVITNYPEDRTEEMETVNNPEDEAAGQRLIPFSREIWIEREDFMEEPPSKFFRLAPGREVRLKSAYIIRCDEVVKDGQGHITELRCSYDPDTRSGSGTDRKVKGTIHWVSASHAIDAEVRIYDRLFMDADPDGHKDKEFKDFLNPESLRVIPHAKLEPGLSLVNHGERYQFIRLGYFCADKDSTPGKPVFNRTVTLKETWKKA
ncbi:MAG TPA: glutamine--tRNA ligase, partial [Bacteroidales bacterium]|nr:glutamine--tRNA ligase [Bacteroidales bacterium]